MDTKILEEIGLTKGEIKVYLALLDLGSSTVTPLSKKANITTGKIYGVLDRLIEKGLTTLIIKNKVKYFSPSNPSKIKSYLNEKREKLKNQEQELKTILPELQEKLKYLEEDIKAETFIGWKGMEAAYQEMIESLKKGDFDYVLGANKGSDENKTKRFYGRIMNKTHEKGIKIKAIYQENSREYFRTSLGRKSHVNSRFLSNTSPSEINIYNNIVMIVIHSNIPIVIRVKSKDVAESFLEYFKTLWQLAKK